MTPARARAAVLVSGAVVAAAVVATLWVFGGPEESRRTERDARRLSHLSALAGALQCHHEVRAEPPQPLRAEDIAPACLAPSEAADLRDPLTGAPYAIAWAADGLRVCAAFEGVPPPGWMGQGFDRTSGCIARVLRPAPD